MTQFFKISSLLIAISFHSCMTTKNTNEKNNQQADISKQISTEKMEEKGFAKGFLTVNKSGKDCPYILNIEKRKDNLDPINLKDFFKNEVPKKVWVKHSNLRMKNRCLMARPVYILEISKRSD